MLLAPKEQRNRFAERRARIREAGLCPTCCTRKPEDGRKVCGPCRASAAERTNQRRVRLRERATLQKIIEAQERAGDRAWQHHLYADAVECYRGALDIPGIRVTDRLRLTEKLVQMYLLENPSAASPLVDWLAKSHLTAPVGSEKAVTTLMAVSEQFWLDSKIEQALPTLTEASKIAVATKHDRLQAIVDLRRTRYLFLLGRNDEARTLLATISPPNESDDASLQCAYYQEKGRAAALLGNAEEAHRHFNAALNAAKQSSEAFHVTQVWVAYAFSAWMLGEIELAKSCFESAILVAREQQIFWRLSQLYVYYADVLATMGQYTSARDYLQQAFAYETPAPLLKTFLPQIGIPLALQLKDSALLARCGQLSFLTSALRSEDPTIMDSIAAAFAYLYVSRGEYSRARALLHRALGYVRSVADSWLYSSEFPLAVARYGARSDIPAARALLEQRLLLPSNSVPQACLYFFDALVAHREKRASDAHAHAMRAVRAFEDLHWYGYANRANALLPSRATKPLVTEPVVRPLEAIRTALTAREQQIAELVLGGLTNRAIAAKLSISENTVEKHMGAIMGHLGVRSRHQLADILGETKE